MDQEIDRDTAERALQMILSAKQVAERMGVSRMAVTYWEREGKLKRMESTPGTALFWGPDVADFEARRNMKPMEYETDPYTWKVTGAGKEAGSR